MGSVTRSVFFKHAGVVAACVIASLGSLTFTGFAQASETLPIPAFSLRLEDQLLANLRYLPVSFLPTVHVVSTTTTTTPTTTTTTGSTTSTSSTTSATLLTTTSTTAVNPPQVTNPTELVPGTFVWRFDALPHALRAQWRVGTNNVILRGALMRFQSVFNLATTGTMNATTWKSLVLAAFQHRVDPSTFNLVYVNKSLPETATLYANGGAVYKTLVNTGITNAPTVNGTFLVYLQYSMTSMSGVNPNGSTYHDTGIPWVSYFNGGDALHGFLRSSYGSPQSLGCVEMTFKNAASIWLRTPIGTLVTVR